VPEKVSASLPPPLPGLPLVDSSGGDASLVHQLQALHSILTKQSESGPNTPVKKTPQQLDERVSVEFFPTHAFFRKRKEDVGTRKNEKRGARFFFYVVRETEIDCTVVCTSFTQTLFTARAFGTYYAWQLDLPRGMSLTQSIVRFFHVYVRIQSSSFR
jgi:hypothetical protein